LRHDRLWHPSGGYGMAGGDGKEQGMERDQSQPRKAAKADPARRYERPRGGQARAICRSDARYRAHAFRRFGFVQSSVVTRWPEIVGETTPASARPRRSAFRPAKRATASCNWWWCPPMPADRP
jgi:hypothetical protein